MVGYAFRTKVQQTIMYFCIAIIVVIFVFPFFWMVISSLKLERDVLAIPMRFIPPVWNWQSYANVFTKFPEYDFPRYILNSVVVTAAAVILALFLCATAGYGFAKYRFKGNSVLFAVVLSTIMIPFQSIVVPLFILVRGLNLQDSYPGLIVPEGLTAFGVFMMRQFFYSVPNDFIEAARMDGANEIQIFGVVSVPMARTSLLALVIFHAQWVWNLLLWPLIVISNPEMRTLPQGIALFAGTYNTPFPEQLAASVIASIPLLVLYLFLSKHFVQGVAMTGLKG